MTALTAVVTVATGLIVWSISSSVLMFALSRRSRRPTRPARTVRYVAVIPCLNEGRVIGATLRHLCSLPFAAILVVDDGSDDDTAEQVRGIPDPRVKLLQRKLPEARLGKGEALNAAYRRIARATSRELGADPARVIVCVIDADGRLERRALDDAAFAFGDHRVGACQVVVRIRNRRTGFLTAMQHFEFVAFGMLYQRAREWTGSVGLGGNGQFVRLSALLSLGRSPWSSCLTEDMDLGIRLLLAGWRNRFLSTSSVTQQAVPEARRLVRQRTRWFQGTLQCARHLPAVAGSRELSLVARMDLTVVLLTPILMLAFSPFMLVGFGILLAAVPAAIAGAVTPTAVLTVYAFAATVPLLLAYSFWRHDGETSLLGAIGAGHLFAVYGFLWPIVGWGAVARQFAGRHSWARTARVEEPEPEPLVLRSAA